jgi:hypothetical protein
MAEEVALRLDDKLLKMVDRERGDIPRNVLISTAPREASGGDAEAVQVTPLRTETQPSWTAAPRSRWRVRRD